MRLLLSLVVGVFVSSAHAGLVVTRVDASAVAQKGTLRFVVEFFDDHGLPQVIADAQVTLDGKPLAKPTVTSAAFEGESFAVAYVVPAHRTLNGPIDSENGVLANPTQLVAGGVRSALRELRGDDRSSVVSYDEAGLHTLKPWSAKHDAAWPEPSRAGEDAFAAPDLLGALQQTVASFAAVDAKAHRVVVLVSDGLDRAALPDRGLEALVEAANAAHVRFVVIGYTLAMPEPLVALEQLAAQTNGRYLAVAPGDFGLLAGHVAALTMHVRSAQVVTVSVPASTSARATFMLQAKAATGYGAKRGGLHLP